MQSPNVLNSGNFCHILRVNQETKTTHSFITISLAGMSVPTPTSCATPLLQILFYALHYIQESPLPPLPLVSLTPSLSSSSPSIHLLSEPLSGARAVVQKAYLGRGVSLEIRLVCI